MAGQNIERREALRYIGIASVAAAFPGFNRWAFACSDHTSAHSDSQSPSGPYKPIFLTQDQFVLVEHIAEMIIPADDTPGAKEAGVAEFIDFMLANRVPVIARYEARTTADAIRQGSEAQERFLSGIGWLNARSKSEFGQDFMKCSAEQQNQLLEEIAYKSKYRPTTESGREFFQMMRDYTVVGYYTTKVGLESLGYPGLRMVWPKMPGCTHPDDPEHRNLSQSSSTSAFQFRITG